MSVMLSESSAKCQFCLLLVYLHAVIFPSVCRHTALIKRCKTHASNIPKLKEHDVR
jgi:hypothetical protein